MCKCCGWLDSEYTKFKQSLIVNAWHSIVHKLESFVPLSERNESFENTYNFLRSISFHLIIHFLEFDPDGNEEYGVLHKYKILRSVSFIEILYFLYNEPKTIKSIVFINKYMFEYYEPDDIASFTMDM